MEILTIMLPNHRCLVTAHAKRGVIYGPAVRFFDVKNSPMAIYLHLAGLYCEQNDPAFAPYTPPYFYGKSTVDLVYTNTVDDTETPSVYRQYLLIQLCFLLKRSK
jgi:hypothetical protein